jgi:hypothetical protein
VHFLRGLVKMFRESLGNLPVAIVAEHRSLDHKLQLFG